MNDKIIARIRTFVPVMVGAVTAYLLTLGIALDGDTQAALTVALTGVTGTLYYVAASWLGRKWSWAGWLLGYPAIPVYVPTSSVAETSVMVAAARDAIALEVAVAEVAAQGEP
jgi:hypothetical protein